MSMSRECLLDCMEHHTDLDLCCEINRGILAYILSRVIDARYVAQDDSELLKLIESKTKKYKRSITMSRNTIAKQKAMIIELQAKVYELEDEKA